MNTKNEKFSEILEYRKFALIPKELRNKNLLYHSTLMENFERILRENEIYGSDTYDDGIATSRNKHYAFGHDEEGLGKMHNIGEVQFILDRDKIKNVCKIKAFDWENYKSNSFSETGKWSNFGQSEDKIYCKNNTLKNLSNFIVGIHVVKNEFLEEVLSNKFIKDDWYIFNENWELV